MMRDYCANIGLMLPAETFGKVVKFEKVQKPVKSTKKQLKFGWCECEHEAHRSPPEKPFLPSKKKCSDPLDSEKLLVLESFAKCPHWSKWMSLSGAAEVVVQPSVVLSRKDVSAAVQKATTAAQSGLASCELFMDGGDDAVLIVNGDRKVLLVKGLSTALSQHVIAVCKDACVRKIQDPLVAVSPLLHKLYLRYAANCTKFPLTFEQWAWSCIWSWE